MIREILEQEIDRAWAMGKFSLWVLLLTWQQNMDARKEKVGCWRTGVENQMDRPSVFGYYETGYMFVNGWTFFTRPKRRPLLESAVLFRHWTPEDTDFFDDHEYMRTADGWLECNLFEGHENKDWR